jgi:hypothetical protein
MGRAVKNHFRLMEIDYRKVLRVIKSCKCQEHLDAANKLIICFDIKHNNDYLLKKIEKKYWFKKKLIERK